jgi:hypothetical protein
VWLTKKLDLKFDQLFRIQCCQLQLKIQLNFTSVFTNTWCAITKVLFENYFKIHSKDFCQTLGLQVTQQQWTLENHTNS